MPISRVVLWMEEITQITVNQVLVWLFNGLFHTPLIKQLPLPTRNSKCAFILSYETFQWKFLTTFCVGRYGYFFEQNVCVKEYNILSLSLKPCVVIFVLMIFEILSYLETNGDNNE